MDSSVNIQHLEFQSTNTMRKIVAILMIVGTVLFSATVKAQITYPYLDSTSTWYELFGGYAPPAYTYLDYNKYYFEGDTIISGNNYYKLYWDQIDSTWDFFTDSFLAVNYSNHIYQGGLREDSTKRFYMCYPSQTSESVLFDFNFSVGDSLTNMIVNYGCNTPPYTVTNIDTVYLGSQSLKRFHFPPGLFNKTLYEGIGSSGGLIWSGSLCQAFEVGGCLIAYKKGLDSLYINCGLGTNGIFETAKKEIVTIFPNPTSGYFTITFSGLTNKGSVEIYNTIGEKVFEDKIHSSSQMGINLKSISSGIYFVRLVDSGKSYCKKLIVEQN